MVGSPPDFSNQAARRPLHGSFDKSRARNCLPAACEGNALRIIKLIRWVRRCTRNAKGNPVRDDPTKTLFPIGFMDPCMVYLPTFGLW